MEHTTNVIGITIISQKQRYIILVYYKKTISAILLTAAVIPATWLCAQTKASRKPLRKTFFTIESSATLNNNLGNAKQSSALQYGIKNSLGVNKPITPRLSADAKVSYSTYLSNCCIEQIFGHYKKSTVASELSMPVTIQYSLFPEHSRVRSYVGAGVLYNNQFVSVQNNSTGDALNRYDATATDKKYISILFTQGVTFEVNTKIQFTESIHFVPDNDKTIGIDIGIGYRIR